MAEPKKAEAAPAEQPEAEKKGGKNLIVILIAAFLFIGGAGAGGFFFLTSKSSAPAEEGTAEEGAHEKDGKEGKEGEKKGPQYFFYEMPEMTVNLSSSGSASRFLRIKVSLELASEADVAALEKVLPRIIDDFQVYLRELRVDDLQGSTGIHRLKEALIMRANQTAHPLEISNVLIKEMLVQ